MFSRSIAVMLTTFLPTLAVILPLGSVHTANNIVAGVLATLLAGLSLVDNRFRYAVATIGGYVALSPFLYWSTLTEKVLAVSWGVTVFFAMIGPFSEAPRVTRVRIPATIVHAREVPGPAHAHEPETRAAA